MQDKYKTPYFTTGPSVSSTLHEGGNRSPFTGGLQPPSVDSERGHVEIPVGALVRYTGTESRITFDDSQTDFAMVLDRDIFYRNYVMGPQPNPDIWPLKIPMLLIQWIQESGDYTDERWKPRAWVEQYAADGDPCMVIEPGWKAGRGPVWVLEQNHASKNNKTIWEVIE
jgi:hypothetical protein